MNVDAQSNLPPDRPATGSTTTTTSCASGGKSDEGKPPTDDASATAITVNGVARVLKRPVRLAHLLQELDFRTKALAVEVNMQLVPRSQHETCLVRPGDQLEIVTLAGGG